MPEGDTLEKVAQAIGPDLEGRELARVRLPDWMDAKRLTGERVARVRAVGKHLLVETEGGLTLRTHLGMHGTWHRYRHGERWRMPGRLASVVLETEALQLVLFRGKDIELMRTGGRGRGVLAALGPDLLDRPLDLDAIVARARSLQGDRAIAEVLLDQRVAAGIGNVYKTEVLFLEGVSPWGRAAHVDDDTLRALYARAAELLRANVDGPHAGRITTADPRSPRRPAEGELWIYGRHGEGCRRCGATIRSRHQGEQARATWWCPTCQPEPRAPR